MPGKVPYLIIAALVLCSFAANSHAAPQDETYILHATVDFPDIDSGEAPFYRDLNQRALAINAANRDYRNKWAAAKTTFTGETGTYDVTISTLVELDGESTYRLLINDKQAGSFTNPESSEEYKCIMHIWPSVQINQGDTIAVESRAHTNGKIPERNGTAWSRGRWRSIALVPSK